MADNHIEINTSTRLGYELRETVDALITSRARLRAFVQAADQMTDAVNWSVVEARFGIPAGKGASLYSLLAASAQALEESMVLGQLTGWLEGVVRG